MDSRQFRNAMGKFATGVTIITTKDEDDVHGMTANAFMSVSLDPYLIAVSIGEHAHMHEKIKNSGVFAVSILSEEQQDMSKYFAGQTKDQQHVEFDWFNDLPVIPHSLAHMTCRIYDAHKAGDHTLFIGEVEDLFVKEEGDPLAFFNGGYRLMAR